MTAAGILLFFAAAPPSLADFHFMKIVEVFGGAAASPNAQYVELKMFAGGQTNLGGHWVRVFDAAGALVGGGTFTFTGPVGNGANQATILIGTSEAASFFGVTPDLLMTPVLPLAGGKVCFDAIPTECVAWGGYGGDPTGVGTPFNSPVGLLRGQAIHRSLGGDGILQASDDTDVSSADFSFGLPSPRKNSGTQGAAPASTCGNSTVEGLEGCDDGGTASGDGCSSACRLEPASITPQVLQVDPAGNGVLEPGETVFVAPAWKNEGASPVPLSGAASTFGGPAGASYNVADETAGYGTVLAGATADCTGATGDCYRLSLSEPPARPATHWDASFTEVLSNGGSKSWLLHVGESFTDVPMTNPFYRFVETILHPGITGGCGPGLYCPGDPNTRAQMAVFLLKASEGSSFTPPACAPGSELFADVPASSGFCPWIEELSRQGITAGCGGGSFCPNSPVTRGQMSVFLVTTFGGLTLYGPRP